MGGGLDKEEEEDGRLSTQDTELLNSLEGSRKEFRRVNDDTEVNDDLFWD